MLIKRTGGASSALVVSGMLTFVFVGCFSDVQSLNSTAEAGFGGEEGNGVVGGSGSVGGAGNAPSTAGRAAAGKGGKNGSAGRSSGTGGTSQAGAGGMAQSGSDSGGTAVAGSPFGGAGSGPVAGGGGSSGAAPVAGSAGYGGAGNGGTGPSGGRGPTAGNAGPGGGGELCNSVDGEGCSYPTFCVDSVNDNCHPSSETETTCAGYCGLPKTLGFCSDADECPDDYACLPEVTYAGVDEGEVSTQKRCVGAVPECEETSDCAPGFVCDTAGTKRCLPDKVSCFFDVGCATPMPLCPVGYAPSVVDDCWGPCVPAEHCGCELDWQCHYVGTCDLGLGRCHAEQAVSPRCQAPYEANTDCADTDVGFALVDGTCQKVPCPMAPNAFKTEAECLSLCAGIPSTNECPRGYALGNVCYQCGTGCDRWGQGCGKACETSEDCDASLDEVCGDGVCQLWCDF